VDSEAGSGTSNISIVNQLRDWREAPLAGWKCVLGWFVATALFFGFTHSLAGPSSIDASESLYATWAIQHGQFACAFPSVTMRDEPEIAPVYPLISGGVAAALRIGHALPYPLRDSRPSTCDAQYPSVVLWATSSDALKPTLNLGYIGWLALLAGLVAWLRAAGRGRTGWEPFTVVLVAAMMPVWTCVEEFFHPQDLVAMGFVFGALAAGLRGRWRLSGALIALAVLSQQFALLVAVPLLILAPPRKRFSYLSAAVASTLAIVAPLLIISSGSAIHALALGSGNGPFFHDSVLGRVDLAGMSLLLVTRILPILLAFALAWWALWKFGRAALLRPDVFLSVMATCIGLRVLFDPNFFPYYLLALSVFLVLLDVQRGRFRGSLVAWLALGILVTNAWLLSPFWWVAWVSTAQLVVVFGIVLIALMTVVVGLFVRPSKWNVLLGVLVIAAAATTLRFGHDPVRLRDVWVWQLVIITTGLALAVGPLRSLPLLYESRISAGLMDPTDRALA
jgi:hypothetical protein